MGAYIWDDAPGLRYTAMSPAEASPGRYRRG